MISLPEDCKYVTKLFVFDVSDLFLSSCHKKQENQTAIFIKFSVDASNITFSSVVNRTPLSVN